MYSTSGDVLVGRVDGAGRILGRQQVGHGGIERARFAQFLGQALAFERAGRELRLQHLDPAIALGDQLVALGERPLQVAHPLLPARALGGERGRLVIAAAFGGEQLVEVGLGLGVELRVFFVDAHAFEFGVVVGDLADQDRRVVEIGSRARHFPVMGFRQAIRARELNVLDEQGEILGDDAVVRNLVPLPLVHAAHYPRPRAERQSCSLKCIMFQRLGRYPRARQGAET